MKLPSRGNPLRLGETPRVPLGSTYLRTRIALNVPADKHQEPQHIQRSTSTRAGQYSNSFIRPRVPVVLHTSSLVIACLFPVLVVSDWACCGRLFSSLEGREAHFPRLAVCCQQVFVIVSVKCIPCLAWKSPVHKTKR
ncbi:hypothetical protein TRVL_05360 [Trypanosoma vivax]|nr:hypothetical protein TRVL_05360 [Trypanosoma vivax]